MVVQINESSLTRNFLPSVYIDKITLESNHFSPPMHNFDPHVKRDSVGLERFAQENSDMMREQRERLENTDEKNALKVSLNLSIKQKIVNSTDLATAWLGSLNLQEFFQMKVVQSTDPVVSALLSSGNATFSLLVDLDAAEFLSAWNSVKANFPNMTMTDAFKRLKTCLENNKPGVITLSDIRTAQVSKYGKQDETVLDPENTWRDSDGNTYQDIPFSLEFHMSEATPEHLAYFTAATLDVEKIIEEFDLEPDAAGEMAFDGKRTIDYVIDYGQVVSKGVVFYDRNGQIWVGPVHYIDETVYAGRPGDSENPEQLTKTRVNNNKVQDFRIAQKLKNYRLDTSPVKNMLNSSRFTTEMGKFSREPVPLKQAAFWSSLALSKDDREDINYFFSINLGDVLRSHTKYGHLFSETQFDWALSTIRITSMRAFRRRVKKVDIFNKLGAPVNAEYVFDRDEEPELVGTYREGGTGLSDGLTEVAGLHPVMPGVYHFSGTDTTMKDKTYGHYRYEIELKIEDNTPKFFQEAFGEMQKVRTGFEEYFVQAKLPSNFQVATNSFKTSFREDVSWNPKIMTLIMTFAQNFNLLKFSGGSEQEMSISDIIALARMSLPGTATPHSIGLVLNLFDNLLETYSQILGYGSGGREPGPDPSVFSLPPQRSQSTPKASTINFYHHFREVWDSDIPKNYGYNYLDVEPSELPGINTMSGTSLEERADIEIATFFKNPGDIQLADNKLDLGVYDTEFSKFSYFSPSTVSIGTGKVSLGPTETFDTSINDGVVSAIASMNFSFGSPNLGGLMTSFAAVRSSFSAMAEVSSAASLVSSVIKNTQDVVIPPAFSDKKEEFNGREMSADCPPDLPDDRDDITTEAKTKVGLANPPKVNFHASQKGAEGLRKYLTFDAIMKGTGMNSNSGVAGKQYRIAEPKLDLSAIAEDRKSFSTPKSLIGLLANKIADGGVGGQSISPEMTKVSGKGLGGAVQSLNTINRDIRARGRRRRRLTRRRERNTQNHSVIQSLPPQIASLVAQPEAVRVSAAALTAGGTVDPNLAAETFATTILNYNSLGALQYFTGYVQGAEDTFMNEPRFETLDRTRLISKAGKKLLCRIVRHEDRDLGFTEPKGLSMPIYDRYFILDVIGGVGNLTANLAPEILEATREAQQETRQAAIEGFENFNANIQQPAAELGSVLEGMQTDPLEFPAWSVTVANSGAWQDTGEHAPGSVRARADEGTFNPQTGLNAMAGQAREARQQELAEERARQYRCYSRHSRGDVIEFERWQWTMGDEDWCGLVEANPGAQTEAERMSCRMWCRLRFSQNRAACGPVHRRQTRRRVGDLGDRGSSVCNERVWYERYAAHQRLHGFASPGGLSTCGQPCGRIGSILDECCRPEDVYGEHFLLPRS